MQRTFKTKKQKALYGFMSNLYDKAMTKDQLKQAQIDRSKKYGIKVKDNTNLTIPAPFESMGAKEGDFSDPVNYVYPIWLAVSPDDITPVQMGQVRNALSQFETNKDEYDADSAAKVESRIEQALKKFGVGEFKKEIEFIPFQKAEDKQVVYGVVLRPNWPDYHGDMISDDDVMMAAHRWLAKSQKLDWQHAELMGKELAYPVESYVSMIDFEVNGYEVKKGDWVMGVKIADSTLWKAIKDGKAAMAFSITGIGRRIKVG